jgi:hypothetical protein
MTAAGAFRDEQQVAAPACAHQVARLGVDEVPVIVADAVPAQLAALTWSWDLPGAGVADPPQHSQRVLGQRLTISLGHSS